MVEMFAQMRQKTVLWCYHLRKPDGVQERNPDTQAPALNAQLGASYTMRLLIGVVRP